MTSDQRIPSPYTLICSTAFTARSCPQFPSQAPFRVLSTSSLQNFQWLPLIKVRYCAARIKLKCHSVLIKHVDCSVEVATFASGCFWGTEHIFVKHYGQKGILKTAVGFTGGDLTNPTYRDVCSRDTGHAEALRIEYDPGRVGYAELVG